MGNKSNTRVCKYPNCKHNDKIHIDTDSFVKAKEGFYHEDCYKEKKDLQLFRSMWCENINSTVIFSELNGILNQLLSRKNVTVGYLLFVLQYVIDNHLNLHYPAGFRYFADKQSIKDAYAKKTQKTVSMSDFSAKDVPDNSPKFSVNRKPTGFNRILGG